MTTRILLIRHGQTDWNAAGRWQGHADIPLNDVGRRQSQRLAARLSRWPISAMYSSDLKRAAGTARILADKLGLQPIYGRVWRERRGGAFEGLTPAEIRSAYPQAWERLSQGITDPPGGESPEELHERVTGAFELLLRRHSGEMVSVVSHGGALRTVIGHVLKMPPRPNPRIELDGNTGLSIVEIRPERPPLLVRLNDVAHLETANQWRPAQDVTDR